MSLLKFGKKVYITLSPTGVTYQLKGNNRTASFSPSEDTILPLSSISSGSSALAGLANFTSVKIVGAKLKAGAGYGIQPPAISSGINGKAGTLVISLVALSSSGTLVGNEISTFELSILDWNIDEFKDIRLSMPSTIPSGAVAFGLKLKSTSVFEVDDFNIQDDFVDQYITPELILILETPKLVKLADSSIID